MNLMYLHAQDPPSYGNNKKCQADNFALMPENLAAYVHLPILDGQYPGMDWLKMAVAVVESMMKKYPVYIHCRAGISRSSMLAAAVVPRGNMETMKINYIEGDLFAAIKARPGEELNDKIH